MRRELTVLDMFKNTNLVIILTVTGLMMTACSNGIATASQDVSVSSVTGASSTPFPPSVGITDAQC